MKIIFLASIMLFFACSAIAGTSISWVPDAAHGNECVTKFIHTTNPVNTHASEERYIRVDGEYVTCNMVVNGPNDFSITQNSIEAAPAFMGRLSDATATEYTKISQDSKIPITYNGNVTPFYVNEAWYTGSDGIPVLLQSKEMYADYNNQPIRIIRFYPRPGGGYLPEIDPDQKLPPKLIIGDRWYSNNGTSWELDQ